MNLHLFLDVVAWIWGPLFSAHVISAFLRLKWKIEGWDVICAFLATLCWGWIVAG